jgi:hypothetical protein
MPLRSTKSKASSIMDDDIDAITPCPRPQNNSGPEPLELANSLADLRSTRSTSPCSDCESVESLESQAVHNKRRDSVRALEQGTDGDPERLWKRMLALQKIYGCYNSARMSAALSSGNTGLLLRKLTT